MYLQRVSELIKINKITNNKMLDDLGLSHNMIYNWSKRNQTPNSDTIIKIAKYFNVTTDYLLGLSDDPNPSNKEETEKLVSNEAEERLIEYFRTLSDLDKGEVLGELKYKSLENKKRDTKTYSIAARDGQKTIELNKEQREKLAESVDNAKTTRERNLY